MRANAGICRVFFVISARRMTALPSRFRRSGTSVKGAPPLLETRRPWITGAVFSLPFSSYAGYPQENTTFGDKVWVSSYILCISVFRVLTDEGKTYYI